MSRHGGKQVMFNLEVEMASKPVVEERLFNVTSCMDLKLQPWVALIIADVHRDVVGLGHPCKPVTLQASEGEVVDNGPAKPQVRSIHAEELGEVQK